MRQLVECVPNFSDGRRPDVYGAIAEAIGSVPSVRVLDVSPDPDHNRTVITFVGTPSGVEEAAFRAIAAAKQLINLDEHRGEHPRIGATDVVPFIPIENVTSGDCKAIAYRLGERVGRELDICVYYYGLAATRPERNALSDIRKGEYEQWRDEVGRNPERAPDAGPAQPAPWGATVIGVRHFLIAYNIYLDTDNVGIAEAISEALRYSSGGFRYLQAKGFLVEGRAQVSMNFSYFDRTPLHRVTEAVRREAARYGARIVNAELVGLVPQRALTDAARWYLQLEMHDDQILEHQLAHPPQASQSVGEFLNAMASSSPTPGGGSAAALAGALAASLTQMVAALTAGRRKYQDVHALAAQVDEQAGALRLRLEQAIDEDARAFTAVMEATRAKGMADDERELRLQRALGEAAEVPLGIARLSRDALVLAAQIVAVGNPNAITDAGSAAYLAVAAVRCAGLNVRINAKSLTDRDHARRLLDEQDALEAETESMMQTVALIAQQRGGY